MAGDSLEITSLIFKEKPLEKIRNMVKNLTLTIEISKNVTWLLLNILKWEYKAEFFEHLLEIVIIILENNFYEPEIFENCSAILNILAKKNQNLQVFQEKFDEMQPIFVKIICYFNEYYDKLTENMINNCLNFFSNYLLGSDDLIEVIYFTISH